MNEFVAFVVTAASLVISWWLITRLRTPQRQFDPIILAYLAAPLLPVAGPFAVAWFYGSKSLFAVWLIVLFETVMFRWFERRDARCAVGVLPDRTWLDVVGLGTMIVVPIVIAYRLDTMAVMIAFIALVAIAFVTLWSGICIRMLR